MARRDDAWLVRRRRESDRDVVRRTLGTQGIERGLSGPEFREVRSRCGYAAREFAEFLHSIRAPITTTRSVYRLESLPVVPARYVDALVVFVGAVNFRRTLQEIEREAEAARRRYEERTRRGLSNA